MSGGVHANPADLRKFATELRSTSSEIKQLSSKLMKTLQSLDWNDPVKNRIEGEVQQAVKGLQKFSDRLDQEHAKMVEKKAGELEVFLR